MIDGLTEKEWEDRFYLSWHWSIHYSREFNESQFLQLGRSLKLLSKYLTGYNYNYYCECKRCEAISK